MRGTGSDPVIDAEWQHLSSGLSLAKFGEPRCRGKKRKKKCFGLLILLFQNFSFCVKRAQFIQQNIKD